MTRSSCFLVVCLLTLQAVPAAEPDLPAQARTALEKATTYLRSISTEGGYLWRYSLDLQDRAGETKATATQIWIQPPGTPSVGMAFLRAFEATKDERYLDAARAAAQALAQGQLESGGWDYLIEFEPQAAKKWYRLSDVGKIPTAETKKRRNISTYDDDNTQSAIRFLLAYCDAAKGSTDSREGPIREALSYGLKKMLEAQYPIGAWPQRFDGIPKRAEDFPVKQAAYPKDYPRVWPHTDYKGYYTLNDNTHRDCIATMLDAYHRTGKAEYLEAAKRGGDFILLAQMPEPQPAWAQQYNAQMEPAWARAFEPPAITGNESVGALRMLMDLYIETGDQKYLKPIPSAIAWFERSAIGTNQWARYYELQTNKQLFGDRDGKIHYRLEDISEERQHGYSWSGDYGVRSMIAYSERVKSQGREALLAEKVKKPGKAKSHESRVREIIAAQDEQGRWVTKGHAKKRDWEFADRLETSLFVKNMYALADYLKAGKP